MISLEELSSLQIELAQALTCTIYSQEAEELRLYLWKYINKRKESLNPSQDRRSITAREHLARN